MHIVTFGILGVYTDNWMNSLCLRMKLQKQGFKCCAILVGTAKTPYSAVINHITVAKGAILPGQFIF